MSLSSFFKGVAFLAAFSLSAGAAMAQEAPKLNEKQRAKGIADAPAMIKGAGVPCDPADAYYIGESTTKTADGKTVKIQVVEVTCKAGGGYILDKNPSSGVVEQRNCTQAFSQNAANTKQIKCVLPGNKEHYAWLTPLVKPYDATCTVEKARWLGQIAEQKTNRYEYGCQGSAGGLIDVPYAPNTNAPNFINCLIAKGNSACSYTTAEQATQRLQPIAKQAKASCVVEKARWLARDTDKNADYYEIGCAGQPGFIVQTSPALVYQATFDCSQAKAIGGCQYTDASQAQAGAREAYANRLKVTGLPCTVSDYTVLGVENAGLKRELVEYKCPEQKWGLAVFLPPAGSAAKAEVMDCFTMVARRQTCGYVPKSALDQQMDVLIKGAKKDCDVQQVNYLGRGDADSVLVEIACTNKRGYVGAVSKSRAGFDDVVACTIAKNRKYPIQCEIPGNGTYVPPAGATND
ncbi:hypothetical protein PQU92_11030 [Asticcacaulis sp. BYS171W]|uniref:DUF4189 domain-containing protein n=1 Tax=Asticcacaulis aquaticus TaxID=2984212 RepID=A0ABT5HV37_9CAUL|nr:hypothetical protein [Asticcacaulis aquaticus]MDC7683813.1 hypothetical protein [Asticcacaulis aquaticus]